MPITHRRSRSFLAAATTATLLAASVSLAPPAVAAAPILTVENGPFTPGSDWGDGITVAATGLLPEADHSLLLYWNESDAIVTYDSLTARSDAEGSLRVASWRPELPPSSLTSPTEGYWVAITAPGEDLVRTPLPVIRERGVHANALNIDATTLADPMSTFWVSAAGFTAGESVSTTATQPDGSRAVSGGDGSADLDTSVTLYRIAVAGATPGPLELTVTGAVSGLTQSVTVQVNQTGVQPPTSGIATSPPPQAPADPQGPQSAVPGTRDTSPQSPIRLPQVSG